MHTIMSDAEEIHVLESKAIQHLLLLAMAAVDRLMSGPGDGNSTLGSISYSLLCLVQECNDHCKSIARAAGTQSTSPQTRMFRSDPAKVRNLAFALNLAEEVAPAPAPAHTALLILRDRLAAFVGVSPDNLVRMFPLNSITSAT